MSTTTIGLIVGLIAYYGFCIGVGFYYSRAGRTAKPVDYFLAGRKIGPIVLFLAMISTAQSAWLMLGHQGLTMLFGMPYIAFFLHISMCAIVPLMILPRQWLLGKKFGFVTPAEMFENYYESSLTCILMVFLAVLFIVPYISMQLIGGGHIFETLTGGEVPYLAGVFILAAAIFLYVFLGGLRSVAITDSLQGILLIGSIFIIGALVLVNLPGGWSGLLEGMKEQPPEWRMLPGVGGTWSWIYIFTFAMAPVGIYSSPTFTMWAFSAKTARIFRWMFLLPGIVIGIYYFVITPIIGGGGRIIFGVLENPDALTPTILMEFAPLVIMVLVGVGMFAAMNSTADAYIATGSTIVARDIYLRFFRKKATSRQEVWFGRYMVIVVLGGSLFVALVTTEFISLLGGLAVSFGLQTLPALVGLLYWRRLTAAGINAGIILGIIAIFVTYYAGYPLDIHCSIWGLGVNFLAAYLISLFTTPISPEIRNKYDEVFNKGQEVFQKKLAEGRIKDSIWRVASE
jgi:Na+/proline symporter